MKVIIMAGGKGTRIASVKSDVPKPEPGLFLQAAQDFNIDLSSSIMIGDSEKDILAGQNAGCKSFQIGNNNVNSFFEYL